MVTCKYIVIVALALGVACAQPAKPSFWKGTPLDSAVESMRSDCANNDDIACMKFKLMSLLDTVFKKDSYQLAENIEINRNNAPVNEVSARSEGDFLEKVQSYVQTHDVTFKMPVAGASVTVLPRNLDQDEIDLRINFAGSQEEAKGAGVTARKSKLKKIIVPILVFILLKALTVVPLALGVLGLKAWNALQLSFFSFVISLALAIFQLCKKIAADNSHPPQIAAHGWDAASQYHYAARSFDAAQPVQVPDAQTIAYRGHV